VTYEIAAWVKDGKKGRFFSLKVQRQGERPARQEQSPANNGGGYQPRTRTPGEYPEPARNGGGAKKPIAAMEDDIPFSAEWR